MLKCVIFDVDGTLTKTIPLFELSILRALNEVSDTEISLETLRENLGYSEEGCVMKLLPQKYDEVLPKYYRYYEELVKATPHVMYNGAMKLVDFVNKSGLKSAVVSGKGKPSLDITFRILGLGDKFDSVMPGLDDSAEKTERIKNTMEVLGVTPQETVYIGDTVSDITASKKAGVPIISAGWDITCDTKELSKHNPDCLALTIKDAIKYLKEIM